MNWTWVKSHDEAVELLKTGAVIFASLDHDLADEHYVAFFEGRDCNDCKEKTGYSTLCWMEEFNVWPVNGVRIHTMNTVRKPVMISVVEKVYGRTFQFQMSGTHNV